MKIKSGLILAVAAGSIAGFANAEERNMTPVKLDVDGYTQVKGYVYINNSTGEKVVSYTAPEASSTVRGSAWTWDNSVIDPCAPDPDAPLSVAIFTGMNSAANGDNPDPLVQVNGINYWQDWFEAPGDTIINGFTFAYFSQLLDPGLDGVDGSDFIMTFTENDRLTDRSGAIAHSPILIEGLLGAEDVGASDGPAGDGLISFQEGNLWVTFIDFTAGATPTDIEIADTNGVSDGAFGPDSIFSGVAGVDLSPTDGTDVLGEGLFNCGFVVGYRQPGVSEGDGLITLFPELAGEGLENPDGPAPVPSTFPNILPMGTALVAPSADASTYVNMAGVISLWPADGVLAGDLGPNDAIGSWDGFTLYNAVGVSRNNPGESFFFGGFNCLAPAPAAAPFYDNPYSTWWMSFNVDGVGDGGGFGCNDADIAEPENVLDLADINAFVQGFLAQDPISDIADPAGVWDLGDINAFVQAFLAGCP